MAGALTATVDQRRLLSRDFTHGGSSSDDCRDENDTTTGTSDKARDANINNYMSATKRYLVYMELPKIKVGDYHKSSCVVGNILRFHFLLKIAENENVPLTLLPIKAYKVPVVNVAVIHRPFIEDDLAKGPIPKSPDVKSPLLSYKKSEEDAAETPEKLEQDFRKGTAGGGQQPDGTDDEQHQSDMEVKASPDSEASPDAASGGGKRTRRDSRHRGKKRKKYFVYCELPKVAVGDYRISSVTSSELIHCHFLMKIAKDETHGQPALRPIKKYRRPRVNFAVIHRSLIVDDEAAGPIPRSPGVKSPMIRQGDDDDDDDAEDAGDGNDVLHTFLGFNYGAAPRRSKYELVSQWSLVADAAGRVAPELVLCKADGGD